jgi:hypothetical protein
LHEDLNPSGLQCGFRRGNARVSTVLEHEPHARSLLALNGRKIVGKRGLPMISRNHGAYKRISRPEMEDEIIIIDPEIPFANFIEQ